MTSILQIFLIFLSILSTEAIKPNIYFTFLNKTDYLYNTKILYYLHVYPSASIPFEITNYFNIWMEISVSHYGRKVNAGIFKITNKNDNSVFARRNLFSDNERNKTSKVATNFNKFSLVFTATDIIEEVTKCRFSSNGKYSKVSIIDYYKENENLTIKGEIYPSRLDAYLKISGKAVNVFCNMKINFKFIIVSSLIFVVLALIILNNVLKFVFKRSPRVHSEEMY